MPALQPRHPRGPVAPLHIGKSSVGWNFSLRIYPDGAETLSALGIERVTSLEDWLPLLCWHPIFDEYDKQVTTQDMIMRIVCRAPGLASHTAVDNKATRGGGRGI